MNYSKVFNNAKWIIVCKIAQSLLQLAVGMLSARYLGPSNYGLINYAMSVAAFVLPLMKLGFDATLVHELVSAPHREKEIMGTSLVLNVISGIACILGVYGFVSIANVGEKDTIIVCVLYSFSLFFAALEMLQYWFQYKLQSKYTSVVMLCSYFFVSAYKIFLLITAKSVYWFAISNSVEFGLIAIALFIIYFKKGGRLQFSLSLGKEMLCRSKHYILAALMLVIIQNTDHIMITFMAGKKENGFYSAAITCATMLQFVYLAIIDSFRPVILENKRDDHEEYCKNVSRLYSLTMYMALAQSAVFMVFAKLIIYILYGSDYMQSVSILRILVWYLVFSVMGCIRNIWILAEQKQKYLWIINLSGAGFNILLNAVLIPFWGAAGAAFASFLTQFFTNFVLGFLLKPIRENNRLLLCGLNPKFVIKEGRNLLKLVKLRGK